MAPTRDHGDRTMTAAASADGAVKRSEFESMTERVTALEASGSTRSGTQLRPEVADPIEAR